MCPVNRPNGSAAKICAPWGSYAACRGAVDAARRAAATRTSGQRTQAHLERLLRAADFSKSNDNIGSGLWLRGFEKRSPARCHLHQL